MHASEQTVGIRMSQYVCVDVCIHLRAAGRRYVARRCDVQLPRDRVNDAAQSARNEVDPHTAPPQYGAQLLDPRRQSQRAVLVESPAGTQQSPLPQANPIHSAAGWLTRAAPLTAG